MTTSSAWSLMLAGKSAEAARHVERQQQRRIGSVHGTGIGPQPRFGPVDGRLGIGDHGFQQTGDLAPLSRPWRLLGIGNGKPPVLAGKPELCRRRARHLHQAPHRHSAARRRRRRERCRLRSISTICVQTGFGPSARITVMSAKGAFRQAPDCLFPASRQHIARIAGDHRDEIAIGEAETLLLADELCDFDLALDILGPGRAPVGSDANGHALLPRRLDVGCRTVEPEVGKRRPDDRAGVGLGPSRPVLRASANCSECR